MIKISCKECDKIQDIAFDKNKPQTVPIAYYRIEEANIALVGCQKHLKIAIDKLNSKPQASPKPTVCVYGCGRFKDLMKHYEEKHKIVARSDNSSSKKDCSHIHTTHKGDYFRCNDCGDKIYKAKRSPS